MKEISTFLTLFFVIQLHAQNEKSFQSIDHIVNETQQVISVKKGEEIDTAYFKSLFLPTANFTVVGEEDGKSMYETMDLLTFVETLTDEYYTNGYYETGTGQITEQYNGIAHVIQSFYGKDSEGEVARGVGSYQLIYADERWWIANMIWTMSPNDGKDIPKKYLKN